MITHFRLMFPSMEDGIDGLADYDRDVLVLKLPNGLTEFSLSHARGVLDKPFHVPEPKEGWRRDFSDRGELRDALHGDGACAESREGDMTIHSGCAADPSLANMASFSAKPMPDILESGYSGRRGSWSHTARAMPQR